MSPINRWGFFMSTVSKLKANIARNQSFIANACQTMPTSYPARGGLFGQQYTPSPDTDRKRYMANQFGWALEADSATLYQLYKRNSVAKAVCTKISDWCWRYDPVLFHGDSYEPEAARTGKFAKFDELARRLDLWYMMHGADVKGRVMRYSAMLVFTKDGKKANVPLKRMRTPEQITGVLPVFEDQMRPTQWYGDADPEVKSDMSLIGKPKMYQFRSLPQGENNPDGEPVITMEVHHSRVITFSEGALDSGIYGQSALEPCLDSLSDAIKVRGSGAEGFFRNSAQKLAVEVGPEVLKQVGVEKVSQALDGALSQYNSSFDGHLKLTGAKANNLQSSLPSNPEQYWRICINEAIIEGQLPYTVLFGHETGERASSENLKVAARNAESRQGKFCNRMISSFVQFLREYASFDLGEYDVHWPNLIETSEIEKVEINKAKAETNKVAFDAKMPIAPYAEQDFEGASFEEEIDFGDEPEGSGADEMAEGEDPLVAER